MQFINQQSQVGAHFSITGGVHKALEKGKEMGATTMQIFTSNQRQWQGRHFTEDEVILWQKTLSVSNMKNIMSHANYLINLGSSDSELLIKSRKAFQQEIERCHILELSYLNFHPGAAKGALEADCLNRIVESLLTMGPFLKKNKNLRLLLETTAGQGTVMGYQFEHLDYIIRNVKDYLEIGVCMDTCHIFTAGYDIRDIHSWEDTLNKFDQIIGLQYLYAIHVNDSCYPKGSRKDYHANLGKGAIGINAFKIMMQHPKICHIPKYLETPNGDTMWKQEIALLRKFATTSY